jgi:DNA-binding PadR family transcriptional regulator
MTNVGDALTGLERDSVAAVLVLSSLAGGDKHGYALVKDVEQFAGIHLPSGTLYPLFSRLESRGLIVTLESDGRRRPYRLTAQGATVLANYITAQQRILKTGAARLKQSWSPLPKSKPTLAGSTPKYVHSRLAAPSPRKMEEIPI